MNLRTTQHEKWPLIPAWAVLNERNEFGGSGPLLSLSTEFGIRERSENEGRAASEDLSGYRRVASGDLVVNRLVARDGAFAVSRLGGLISPAYWVLRARQDFDTRFVNYLLHSSHYLAEITARSKSMPPAQFDLPWEQFRTLPLVAPDPATQHHIADYLDVETARIDALIVKEQRVIELLDERIDSLVMSWVGRSSLAGAANIESVQIKRVLTKSERWTRSRGNVVTAFRDGEVVSRATRSRDGFTDAWTDSGQLQVLTVGSVVIHGLDGFAGAIGDSQSDGVCSPVYHVCLPVGHGDPAFYGRLLRLLATSGYLGSFATSTRQRAVDFRNWDMFSRISVPLVPVTEQKHIGDLIRATRPLRAKIDELKVVTNERRQALITAAVTGELEIPGVAA